MRGKSTPTLDCWLKSQSTKKITATLKRMKINDIFSIVTFENQLVALNCLKKLRSNLAVHECKVTDEKKCPAKKKSELRYVS